MSHKSKLMYIRKQTKVYYHNFRIIGQLLFNANVYTKFQLFLFLLQRPFPRLPILSLTSKHFATPSCNTPSPVLFAIQSIMKLPTNNWQRFAEGNMSHRRWRRENEMRVRGDTHGRRGGRMEWAWKNTRRHGEWWRSSPAETRKHSSRKMYGNSWYYIYLL